MNEIKKIYDLLYSPIITPYNLLENSKLENYLYVKYYRNENNTGLISEMKCIDESNHENTFYYHFDQDDKLNQIFMEKDFIKNLVYDRKNELKSEIENYTFISKSFTDNKIA